MGEVHLVLRDLRNSLSCGICSNLLEDPHRLPCHHSFCKVCISQHLFSKSHCPKCKQPCWSKDAKKNHMLCGTLSCVREYLTMERAVQRAIIGGTLDEGDGDRAHRRRSGGAGLDPDYLDRWFAGDSLTQRSQQIAVTPEAPGPAAVAASAGSVGRGPGAAAAPVGAEDGAAAAAASPEEDGAADPIDCGVADDHPSPADLPAAQSPAEAPGAPPVHTLAAETPFALLSPARAAERGEHSAADASATPAAYTLAAETPLLFHSAEPYGAAAPEGTTICTAPPLAIESPFARGPFGKTLDIDDAADSVVEDSFYEGASSPAASASIVMDTYAAPASAECGGSSVAAADAARPLAEGGLRQRGRDGPRSEPREGAAQRRESEAAPRRESLLGVSALTLLGRSSLGSSTSNSDATSSEPLLQTGLPPSQKSAAQKCASQRSLSQTSLSQKSLSQTPLPQKFASQDAISQQSAPQQSASQQSVPQQSALQQSAPQQSASQQSASQQSASQQSASQQSAPQQSASQNPLSQQSAPQQSVPQQSASQNPLSQNPPSQTFASQRSSASAAQTALTPYSELETLERNGVPVGLGANHATFAHRMEQAMALMRRELSEGSAAGSKRGPQAAPAGAERSARRDHFPSRRGAKLNGGSGTRRSEEAAGAGGAGATPPGTPVQAATPQTELQRRSSVPKAARGGSGGGTWVKRRQAVLSAGGDENAENAEIGGGGRVQWGGGAADDLESPSSPLGGRAGWKHTKGSKMANRKRQRELRGLERRGALDLRPLERTGPAAKRPASQPLAPVPFQRKGPLGKRPKKMLQTQLGTGTTRLLLDRDGTPPR